MSVLTIRQPQPMPRRIVGALSNLSEECRSPMPP
jgi:hypothetical protein